MTRRHGAEPPERKVDVVADGYRHVARTGIFRVAALDDRLVALACAIVRADRWFLSGFWADPALRLRGIGGPLLREVWDEGRRRGTRVHYVWASVDHAAIASYLRLGMLPGTQLFAFAGALRSRPAPVAGFAARPLAAGDAAALDRALLGAQRPDDHAFWSAHGRVARAVTRGGDAVGYFYRQGGAIGPAAWADDDAGRATLALAFQEAGDADVELTIPGTNHLALRTALASGLRLIRQSHLLWTEPVGPMERYLPSGPLLF